MNMNLLKMGIYVNRKLQRDKYILQFGSIFLQ